MFKPDYDKYYKKGTDAYKVSVDAIRDYDARVKDYCDLLPKPKPPKNPYPVNSKEWEEWRQGGIDVRGEKAGTLSVTWEDYNGNLINASTTCENRRAKFGLWSVLACITLPVLFGLDAVLSSVIGIPLGVFLGYWLEANT